MPPWVEFVLDRMDKQFVGMNERLDKLVTQDAFRQEQTRVNERLGQHDREIGSARRDIQAEATARSTENKLKSDQEIAQRDKLLQTQKQTQWQWFAIVAGPIVVWLISNFLPPAGG